MNYIEFIFSAIKQRGEDVVNRSIIDSAWAIKFIEFFPVRIFVHSAAEEENIILALIKW